MAVLGFFLLYVSVILGVFAAIALIAEKLDERDPQIAEDMRRIWNVYDRDSIDDDPERKQADHEAWDRKKALEEGHA